MNSFIQENRDCQKKKRWAALPFAECEAKQTWRIEQRGSNHENWP